MKFQFLFAVVAASASLLWGGCGHEAGNVVIENEHGKIEIDRDKTGQIVSWKVGDLSLIEGTSLSPVALRSGEDESLAEFAATKSEVKKRGEGWLVTVTGTVKGVSSPIVEAVLTYEIAPALDEIAVSLKLTREATASGRVAQVSWRLPVSLQPRKRVYFRGDHALEWETRYFYQFHTTSTGDLFKEPERNEWRYFALEQKASDAFLLWKAESETTSLLIMQQGKIAAPYAQIYDEKKGVTLQYPQLQELAPKTLRIDAAGTGLLVVDLWPANAEPLRVDSPEAERLVFGPVHRFQLSANVGEKAVKAKRAELNKLYQNSAPVTADTILQEPPWLRTTALSNSQPTYVTGGFPFAKGELKADELATVLVEGKAVSVQQKPLGYWPDGSIKWLQLVFPFDAMAAKAVATAPYLSLRNGKFIPLEIKAGKTAENPVPATAIEVEKSGDGYRIKTGPLVTELGTGTRWLRYLALNGREILRSEAPSPTGLAYVDYLRDFTLAAPGQRVQGGEKDSAALVVSSISLVESGSLRTVVRLEGMVPNKEPTKVILWLEFLAGRSDFKLTHTAEFLFKDPRKTLLTGLGIDLPIKLEAGAELNAAGMAKTSGDAKITELGLLQPLPGYSYLYEGKRVLPSPTEGSGESQGWISASDSRFQVVGAIRNFWQLAPKGLVVSSQPGSLKFELWPSNAAPMDVRRYSNYPHRSQGEQFGVSKEAIDNYYLQDPFVGVSRSHEIYIGLFEPSQNVMAASLAADFQSPPLLYAGERRYEETGITLPGFNTSVWRRGAAGLNNFVRFWLFHRELHRWYGFWDFGDFRHYFQDGYGTIIPPKALTRLVREQGGTPPIKASDQEKVTDYTPPNDWAYDNGRWGWSNTEGLANGILQGEYLRTGNRVVFFASEAMARHTRDVIIRHAGKWFGAGTRHGVQHWSDGNHEERQTIASEYRMNYFLTGEPRSREVIEKLYTEHYTKTPVSVDASHSARLAGLIFHWELTGSDAEAAQLKRYVNAFIDPNGIFEAPVVSFPNAEVTGPGKKLNAGSMFFHNFGGITSLLEYEYLTEDPALSKALIAMADSYVKNEAFMRKYARGTNSPLVLWPICYAARHAQDAAPYRAALEQIFQSHAWKIAYQPVTNNPARWTGSSAYLISSVPSSLFGVNYAPYLLGALGDKEIWSPAIAAAFEKIEEENRPKERLPLSWQSEYDNIPELAPYLEKDQPWRKQRTSETPSSSLGPVPVAPLH